jgi:hypothetical protein
MKSIFRLKNPYFLRKIISIYSNKPQILTQNQKSQNFSLFLLNPSLLTPKSIKLKSHFYPPLLSPPNSLISIKS